MDTIEILFGLANIAYLVGTTLLTRKVLKNRNSIKDYDLIGSLLTTIGLLFTITAQIVLGYWIVIMLLLPTLAFWILVSILSFKSGDVNYDN